MQYSAILIAAASLALAQAKIAFTTLPSSVEAGKPVTLKWNGEEDGPVTITLRKGDSNDLKTLDTITSNAKDGSFVWTPSKSLSNANDYALQISQGVDDVNYTGQFALSGGSDSDDSSSSASASGYPTSSAPVSSQASSSSASVTVTKETTVTAVNSTTTASHSVYMTGTAPVPSASGTGVNVSRNTTFSSATPTRSASHSGGLIASTTGAATTTAESGSETSEAAATSASAGAASHMEIQIGAGLAAVLGLFAML